MYPCNLHYPFTLNKVVLLLLLIYVSPYSQFFGKEAPSLEAPNLDPELLCLYHGATSQPLSFLQGRFSLWSPGWSSCLPPKHVCNTSSWTWTVYTSATEGRAFQHILTTLGIVIHVNFSPAFQCLNTSPHTSSSSFLKIFMKTIYCVFLMSTIDPPFQWPEFFFKLTWRRILLHKPQILLVFWFYFFLFFFVEIMFTLSFS